MEKLKVIQMISIIIVCSGLIFMFISTDVYEKTEENIVEVLCLSCLKLQPKTSSDFTFKTATGDYHPEFIIENLSIGPIFLHYSEKACPGCDVMYPVIKDLLNIEFQKNDQVYEIINFEGKKIVYFYINIDYNVEEMIESLPVYDKDNIQGLPMFSFVTLGYDRGVIKPYYTTIYGTLDTDWSNEKRLDFLNELLMQTIALYEENIEGFI